MTSSGRDGSALRVGAFTAGCLLVSNMIGTGVFSTTGFLARDLGSPAWILGLWAAGALYALCGAVCYAELGAAFPRVGGEYVYLREAFGPLPAFLSGWASLTAGFGAAIASCAVLFALHLRELVPALGGADSLWARTHAVELGLVWGLTAVHVAGTRGGGALQRVLTGLKVGAVGALLLLGLTLGDGGPHPAMAGTGTPTVSALLVGFLFVTFSYSGWNAIGYVAGELERPERSLPRASLVGTAVVALAYLALNGLYLHALPIEELAAAPLEPVAHKAAAALFGARAGAWISALLTVSIAGAASAMVWAGPRVYQAMAEDGVLPAALGRRASGGAPVGATLLQSGWVTLLVLSGTYEALLVYASVILIAFSALAVAATVVLRRTRPALARPFRARPWPLAPLAFLAASAALLWAGLQVRSEETLWGLVTIAAGLPFYAWMRRS